MSITPEPTYKQLLDDNQALRAREEARGTAITDLDALLVLARQELAGAQAHTDRLMAQVEQAQAGQTRALDAAAVIQAAREAAEALVESLTADHAALRDDRDRLAAKLIETAQGLADTLIDLETTKNALDLQISFSGHLAKHLTTATAEAERLERELTNEKGRHAAEVRELRGRLGASWWSRIWA